MTFEKRRLIVTFKLGRGAFGEDGFDAVTLEGLRCQADIAMAGGISKGALNLRVWGMDSSKMNRLAKVGRLANSAESNRVFVDAGSGKNVTNVFQGSIYRAWVDFNGVPDVCLNVEAAAGWLEAVKPAVPISYRGGVDAADVLRDLAGKLGAAFENNGVSGVMLSNPALSGSVWDQVVAVAQAAGIEFSFDRGTFSIWPRGGHRRGDPMPVSAETGLVGYPRFNDTGISLQTLFQPGISTGQLIQVQSDLKPACGSWRVNMLSHNLSAEIPGGPWFTNLEASNYDRIVLR